MKGCGSIMGFDNGILLAPMGPDVAGPELVAAVANAGGVGLLASPLVSTSSSSSSSSI